MLCDTTEEQIQRPSHGGRGGRDPKNTHKMQQQLVVRHNILLYNRKLNVLEHLTEAVGVAADVRERCGLHQQGNPERRGCLEVRRRLPVGELR